MTTSLDIALKEWDLVIAALLAGEQAVLLRKGGIYEANNEFELEHRRFLLFPTYVHQQREQIKPAWRGRVVAAKAEPEVVTLRGWAEVVRVFEVPGRAALERLGDLHVWDKPLLDMRFAYRPEKPLYLVVVRAWRLGEVVSLPNSLEYAGCKSWVPLGREVSVAGSVAAMGEERVEAVVGRVREALEGPVSR